MRSATLGRMPLSVVSSFTPAVLMLTLESAPIVADTEAVWPDAFVAFSAAIAVQGVSIDAIHAERRLADPTPAVVADAVCDPALPPLTGPQLASSCALSLEQIGVDGGVELTHGPTAPRTALPTHASARRPGPPRSSAPWP